MSVRELVVLGTASQVPTRHRNHNGYLLRWDGEGLLFDPGEGTQRQMLHAGVSATGITRIGVTHFHGDHCLGLPGVVQRINLDRVPHPVDVYYPATGEAFYERLTQASAFHRTAELRPRPIEQPGRLAAPGAPFELHAARLSHPVDSFGYRLVEPDGTRLVPERLAAHGLRGPAVGRLQREGAVEVDGRRVTLAEVSEHRPGQRFGFVMDTRLCDGVYELAEGADLLVIEATFLSADAALAEEHGHLTAAQAAKVATESGVSTLVLTHFSQRYPDLEGHLAEARAHFDGRLVVAEDLMRVSVPPRRADR
ncbi:ribonuclease Z [Kitasatospora sp. MMS16-BH015]|uniref:ribonuclease Z n=1 Tax=Kitasatospora sp. MMS16-BH015 TaxID=2018025 RepID=UPI000CA34263|nr:ribonuclease Z [Kitasatospora sp. MMS16-BH015]AUG77155.1 ribonuclease Z [Kitasatospora sp. MMS16-BH015]